MRLLSFPICIHILIIAAFAQNPRWVVYNKDNSSFPGGKYLTDNALDMEIDRNGNIWVATRGAAIFGKADWEHWHAGNSGLPDTEVYTLEMADDSTIWFGTFLGGLLRLRGAVWDTFTTSNSPLPSDFIFDLDMDARQTLWIATSGGGLASYANQSWNIYTTDNSGLSTNQLLSVYCDTLNTVWVGTYDGGLYSFDGATWTHYTTGNSGLPSNVVHEIARDQDGALWICTWSGIARFHKEVWTTYSTPLLPDKIVRSVLVDRNNHVWVGTNNGLVKFDHVNWTLITDENALLQGGRINCLAADKEGRIWIGTSMVGVYVFDESGASTVYKKPATIHAGFMLEQNFPNPFNPLTTIRYHLPGPEYVRLVIYNLAGQEITVLADELQGAGEHQVTWTARSLSSGVYLCRLYTGRVSETRKLVLQR